MFPKPAPGYILDVLPISMIWTGEKWIPADGRLVSRKDHPELYAVFGTQFTDEDERCCTSELFQLPDLREKGRGDNGSEVSRV